MERYGLYVLRQNERFPQQGMQRIYRQMDLVR